MIKMGIVVSEKNVVWKYWRDDGRATDTCQYYKLTCDPSA